MNAVENAFQEFTSRKDVSVVLITQNVRTAAFTTWAAANGALILLQVAELIRHLVDKYNKPIPSVLEIPSKETPYDPSKDAIMKRAQKMFSTDDMR